MTIQELYQNINGDYDQAVRVLRMDKLIDKHIRKFPENNVSDNFFAAGNSMNPTELFETAHALKGVCSNLGLKNLSDAFSEISEEYRPGSARKFSDEEVKTKIEMIRNMYANTVEGIKRYAESVEQSGQNYII